METATPCVGGYEFQFVTTPPDWLICNICHYPSREPYLSGCCGNTFCKSCLEGVRKAAVSDACPICRNEEFVTFHNKQADRLVRSLHIFCTNKEKGCEWQGEVNDIIKHLGNSSGCQFEDVTCSNDCGKCLQRQYLTSHVEDECIRRKVDCQYCHITGEHQFIEGEHKEQCPKFPIACPNNCEVGSVPRDDVEEHMKMCPLELIQCEYHVVGCEERMARKDQKKHNKEKIEEHLSLAVSTLNTTKQEQIILAAKTDEALARLETKFQTKITEIETATQKRIAELESKLKQKAQQVDRNTQLDKRHTDLDTFSSKLSSGNQVVPVIVKMSEYSKKRRDGVEWYSESFYTHHMGYKMCLVVYPAGWISSFLALQLYLMKGPYDDKLRWPLKGRCTVKLLNQISGNEHHLGKGRYLDFGHQRVTSAERSSLYMWHSSQFIFNEDLHEITTKHQYLKDDCVFLQVDYKLD